jgi:hypothetical protein
MLERVIGPIALFAALAGQFGAAQTTPPDIPCRPQPDELRAFVLRTTKATSDATTVLQAMDDWAGIDTKGLVNPLLGFGVYQSAHVSITLYPPYFAYRFQVSEALRRSAPVDEIEVPKSVRITVNPMTIDTTDIDDIERVIVERNRARVTPWTNGDFALKSFSTKLGPQVLRYAGNLEFSCSAFIPGGEVIVTVIPTRGANKIRRLTPRELTLISGLPGEPAAGRSR